MSVTETARSPRLPSALSGRYRLLVLHCPTGRDVGRTFQPGDGVVIGRVGDGSNQIVLDDSEVSRRHAVLGSGDDVLTLRDAGSRNGTFVNGCAVERALIKHGDVIRVGSHLLLVQAVPSGHDGFGEPVAPDPKIVGRSHELLAILRRIGRGFRAPALVVGETGVGKELIAEAIHRSSGRSGPLVSVNCAALPQQLAESELFGHVAGAFTGAHDRRGLFVEADGGSLFLDEIGEMSPELQPVLLRAIATGEIRPVGADRRRTVDVRIIAATNRELRADVERGQFRADLYARLTGEVIEVPPLRQRREDILELAQHFLGLAGSAAALSADAAEALVIHDWPFNVRELEQLARSLADRGSNAAHIELDDLPAPLRGFYQPRRGAPRGPAATPRPVLGVARRAPPTAAELEAALRAYAANVAKVASHFGKDRRQIYRWAARLGLDIDAIRGEYQGKEPS